jgi:hypothetical protein
MPGFNVQGGGATNVDKNNKAEFRRKHRWRVAAHDGSGLEPVDWLYLQKAARPSFKYLEAIVHHDQEQAYFAGKQEWETITLTFYDVESGGGGQDISRAIYNWIAAGTGGAVGKHEDATMQVPNAYKKDLELDLTKADGTSSEHWTLFGCWPLSVNFQELDYTNTEIQLIEVVVRFDRAQRHGQLV